MTGVPVDRGMVFVGGSEVRVDIGDISDPEAEIEAALDVEPESMTEVPGTGEYIVTFTEDATTPEELEDSIGEHDELSISELSQISPTLGDDAQQTALMGILAAFVLMSGLVIVLFRSIIPAFVIILSAVSNILIAAATMNLVGIELTMGTVGALLMLIGYSVDSDILLNTYVLKGTKSTFNDRVHDAMRTGITMTVTSLSAMIVMAIVATAFGIELLAHMGFVLAVGLAADLMNTYLMNVAILRWYVNRGDAA